MLVVCFSELTHVGTSDKKGAYIHKTFEIPISLYLRNLYIREASALWLRTRANASQQRRPIQRVFSQRQANLRVFDYT